MRIHIFKKYQEEIKIVSSALDRSPQFIVNMIVDDIFEKEHPEEILKKIMLKNFEKIKLNNKKA